MNYGSRIGKETAFWLHCRWGGVRVPLGPRIFTSTYGPDRLWGSNEPPIQWVQGSPYPVEKRQGREADHSPPPSAEIKKTWIIYPLPHTHSWHSA
jgi:hypothetical protein